MPVPIEISRWLKQNYPKPDIDTDWLSDCYTYVRDELQPRDMDDTIRNVELQFLASDLRDSTIPRTGLPVNFPSIANTRLQATILVQIVSITDIGHSAFNLHNVRQNRIEKADLSGLVEEPAEGEAVDDEDLRPIPKYPRGMLKFELTDGSNLIHAIEYRKLPQLVLGETPLGCKLLLKNLLVRKGIAFLEPASVVVKGSSVEDLEANQDMDFLRGLMMRLGRDPPEPNGRSNGENRIEEGDEARDRMPPPPPLGLSASSPNRQRQPQSQPQPCIQRPLPTMQSALSRRQPQPDQQMPPPRPANTPGASQSQPTPHQSPPPSPNTLVGAQSTYFSPPNASSIPVTTAPLRLANLSARAADHPAAPGILLPDVSFSDPFVEDIDADFLAELESVEQKALSTLPYRQVSPMRPARRRPAPATAGEVIEILSDEDSRVKESVGRRVRQKTSAEQDSAVIDISD